MEDYIDGLDKINIVINILCKQFNMKKEDLNKFIKKRENKYLLLLLLKNYKCLKKEDLEEIKNIINGKMINYNLKKAEEKLLINKDFRELYFKIEERLDKII
ncbi:hypothetical protein [Clostridium septicum]|uniref:Ribose-5-phosphate isomerase n=1 Tax=Clostridium septicum TaxID=1504 RepID=A0A9N7PKZ2_CLOSE|nr:hypothetical protein [Clostridium septicum]AYE34722.1 hypothetical protein CP523_10080 [Clostridium septicum]MDU1312769.1 hypothetical protein [Clostridium septicum]QAS60123.1 hypothetical protein EI377_04880 [Clostridium septicum]UEC20631.1 hypothetical protein LK444_14750 [Clostridium septicum]USS01317.1 hypothetical protein NH397_02420 [Clostridium septicum]